MKTNLVMGLLLAAAVSFAGQKDMGFDGAAVADSSFGKGFVFRAAEEYSVVPVMEASDAVSDSASEDDAMSKPFLSLELKMAPFRGKDPDKTRERVEAFIQELGLSILSYQDNEELRYAEFCPVGEGEGMLERFRFLRELRVQQKLEALPGIRLPIDKVQSDPGTCWNVLFQKPLYLEDMKNLFDSVGVEHRLDYFENAGMQGLWLDIDISGMADPHAAAESLKAEHPQEVLDAQIKVRVPVLDVRMGGKE
ncbi:MAG: hypothetical protein WCU88_13395 [Elusimicrobiota bacterium]|jgi:hypothetical protein